MNRNDYSAVTPIFRELAKKCQTNDIIDQELYTKYEVKRGLRDLDGRGVLTGLTDISTINAYKNVDGELVPIDGELYYRGINIYSLRRHGDTRIL